MQITRICTTVFVFYSTLIATESARFSINPICSPPRGDECIEVYKCPYFASLLRNSEKSKSQIITEIRHSQCGFANRNPAVCCSKRREEENIETKIKHRNLPLLPLDKCGTLSLDSRITNGKTTTLNELRWMALIVYNTENGLEFLCGGTLISEKYVLTAAHCILKTIIGVRLGEHDVLSKKDCDQMYSYCAPPVQDFHIDKVILHADYNKIKDQHDIALIRLSDPAQITYDNVQPICLPLEEIPNLDGKMLSVAGWGLTETGFKSSVLQKASVPLIPLPVCQKIFEGQANISSKQLCAGGNREDSCNGDSGGPLSLVVPVRGIPRHVQYGIVSYGPKDCGTLGMPGIYTRVDAYINWILDTLKP